MSDDDVRVLPASSCPGPWLRREDPTAILGDPWGRGGFPRDSCQGPHPSAGKGILAQAMLRLQHVVMARPQA